MISSIKLLGLGILAVLIGIAMAVPVSAYGSGGTGAQISNVKFGYGFHGGFGRWVGNYWSYPSYGGRYYYSPWGYSTIDPYNYYGGTQVCTYDGYGGYTCYGPNNEWY
jgi:hypothetical protein